MGLKLIKLIKYTLLVFLVAGPALAKNPRFSLSYPNGHPVIRDTLSDAYVIVRPVSPDRPKILRVEKVSHFWLVHFFSGDAGTYRLIRHEAVAVFDTRTNAFHEDTYVTKLVGYAADAQPYFAIVDGEVVHHIDP